MRASPLAGLAGLLVAGAGATACHAPDAPRMTGAAARVVTISFAPGATLHGELATTPLAREVGLMDRDAIGADSGMVFVWPADQDNLLVAFYMRNTHVDLSVAFLDASRHVLNIDDMAHDTETLHFATAPFRYAVEAPIGWFANHGVAPGTAASFVIPAGVTIEP